MSVNQDTEDAATLSVPAADASTSGGKASAKAGKYAENFNPQTQPSF